jgi:hypothetical protein
VQAESVHLAEHAIDAELEAPAGDLAHTPGDGRARDAFGQRQASPWTPVLHTSPKLPDGSPARVAPALERSNSYAGAAPLSSGAAAGWTRATMRPPTTRTG